MNALVTGSMVEGDEVTESSLNNDVKSSSHAIKIPSIGCDCVSLLDALSITVYSSIFCSGDVTYQHPIKILITDDNSLNDNRIHNNLHH